MSSTLRYVPSRMLGQLSNAFDKHGNSHPSYALQNVTSIDIFPPKQHPAGSPLVADCFCVRVTLASGNRCWFGSERAFIDSNLRVAMLVNDRDEVLAKWDSAEPAVKAPRKFTQTVRYEYREGQPVKRGWRRVYVDGTGWLHVRKGYSLNADLTATRDE